MAKTRILTFVFFFVSALVGISLLYSARSASCDAIVGKWAWFVGGEVTINPDGTFAQQSGNAGSWECTNAAQGRFTLRWRQGGYVNQLALSADGKSLSSADPTQQFVTAKRVGTGANVQPRQDASALPASSALMMSTQTDGSHLLPKDLPQLMKVAMQRARQWHADAIPVLIEFQHQDAPNPAMRGPEIRLSFLSPSQGTGLHVTVTTAGARTFAFNQKVNWGTLALPPIFLDLPAAVRIARKNGMKGPLNRANLKIWTPSGAPPVLAWMVGDKTVNGATGEIIAFDVTGYVARYNAQWERAAQGLRALMLSARGAAAPSGSGAGKDPDPLVNLLAIMNSTDHLSCAENGGYWYREECIDRR